MMEKQYEDPDQRPNTLEVEGNPSFMAGGGLTYGYNPVDIGDFDTLRYADGTKLTEPALSTSSTNSWKVNFKLLLQVEYGQSVCVIGSIPELGNW
jgi:hypothetical protein